jgi:competence protein ComEA
MRRLVWKKKLEAGDYIEGLLILILIMASAFSLKTVFTDSVTREYLLDEKFFIAVAGDIRDPGVYAFDREVSPEALIKRGGGIEDNSYSSFSFCDIPLRTGIKIDIKIDGDRLVFSQDEMSAFYKVTLGIPLSINSETEAGLTALPGIGPRLAERIVGERSARGGFKDLNEIKSVHGVGEKLYNKIVPYIQLL